MSLNPGQAVIGDYTSVTYESGESFDAGDLVAINSGQIVTADDTNDTNPIGVAMADASGSGEEVAVAVRADGLLTNVASGVTAGVELGTSATEGQAASGSDDFHTLTDEGAAAGLSTNEDIPTGYAAVKF